MPREFVFMDRAAIGLGGVFLHLDAELNYYRLFNEAIERFSVTRVADRQTPGAGRIGTRGGLTVNSSSQFGLTGSVRARL